MKIQTRADIHYYDPDGTTWCGAATPPGYGHPECWSSSAGWPISDGSFCPRCGRPICVLCLDVAYERSAKGTNPWRGRGGGWTGSNPPNPDLSRVVVSV